MTSLARERDRLGLHVPEASGLILSLLFAVWLALSSKLAGGDAGPAVALLGASVAAFLIGWLSSRSAPWVMPVTVVVVVMSGTFAGWQAGDLTTTLLGYSNADSALYLQATAAAMSIVVLVRSALGTIIGLVMVAVFAGLTLVAGSIAGSSLLLLLCAAFAGSWRRPRMVIAGAASFTALILLLMTWLGSSYQSESAGPAVEVAARWLSQNRLQLWSDALELLEDHPWIGVGPGRFRYASATASDDEDLRWAHNDFLQQAAETGTVGLILMLALFGSVFMYLWRAAPQPLAAIGAAAVAVLAIQASVDYVLHFPPVVLACAGLTGLAAGRCGRT